MHLEACWHGQTVKMIFPDPGCSLTPSHPSWFPPLMVTVSVPAPLTESQLCLGVWEWDAGGQDSCVLPT